LKLKEVEKAIFLNIMDMYWNEEIRYRDKNDLEKTKSFMHYNTFKEKDIPDSKELFAAQVRAYISEKMEEAKIDSPEDMYLSVDGKYFVNHQELEEAGKTSDSELFLKNTIAAYSIDDNTQKINTKTYKIQPVSIYKNFSKNIKDMKKIFVSFSSKDEEYKDEFIKHTKGLQDDRLIEKPFACSDIMLGADWDATVKKEIDECDIMVCLISVDFINSNYIRQIEVKGAMKQNKTLIPIIIRPCDWKTADFAKFQAAFSAKCISLDLQNPMIKNSEIGREACWAKIIEEMREKLFNKVP
jgi:internalin A